MLKDLSWKTKSSLSTKEMIEIRFFNLFSRVWKIGERYKANKMGNKIKSCLILILTFVRHGSHRGGSPQNVLRDEQTCGTILASAYVLRRLSAVWSQLQMKERSPSGSECWMVCRHWTPEIEFNKRLSSSIIRLANYNVTTSLIYKVVV